MTTFSKAYRAVVNDWSCVSFNWRIKGLMMQSHESSQFKNQTLPGAAVNGSRKQTNHENHQLVVRKILSGCSKFCRQQRCGQIHSHFHFSGQNHSRRNFFTFAFWDSQPPELCIWRVRVCVGWRSASCRSFHGMAGKVQRKCKNNSERSHQEVMGKNTFKNEAAVLCRMCNNCSSK